MPTDLKGKVIDGKYLIIDEIGRGGMGVVYKANDLNLARLVAIKMIRVEHAQKAEAQAMFEREAKIAAKLGDAFSDSVVRIHYFNKFENQYYIVMEYIEGENLYQILKRLHHDGRWLGLYEAINIIINICQKLHKIHCFEEGYVHRDIKPANIMYRSNHFDYHHPIFMDFGIATLAGEIGQGATHGYAPPEQERGEKVDRRADIYALGAMLVELITGELPRIGLHKNLPDFLKINPNLPHKIIEVIQKALQEHPDNRYATTIEMASELKKALKGVAKPTQLANKTTVPFTDVNELPTPPPDYINDPHNFNPPEQVRDIIKKLYPENKYKKVTLLKEYGSGKSGAYVYGVEAITQKDIVETKHIVKVASAGLISKEDCAYREYVEDSVHHKPKLIRGPEYDKGLGGLVFGMAEGGIFDVESLIDFCKKANIKELEEIQSTLFKIMHEGFWYQNEKIEYRVPLRQYYRRLMPVDLLTTYENVSQPKHKLSPRKPLKEITIGDTVQLNGLEVVKVDVRDKTITLKDNQGKFIRVKFESEVAMQPYLEYEQGQIFTHTLAGRVETTRDQKLTQLIEPVLENHRHKSSHAYLPQQLPNPQDMVELLLNQPVNIKIANGHGDFNWENILVRSTSNITLIDFAESGHKPILTDLLRYETEAIVKFVAYIIQKHKLDPLEAIYLFYSWLDQETFRLSSPESKLPSLPQELKTSFAMLKDFRDRARAYLGQDFQLYYQALTLHLIGAMKFDLNDMGKTVAFWGAAVVAQWTDFPPKSGEKGTTIVIVSPPTSWCKRLIAKVKDLSLLMIMIVCSCLLIACVIIGIFFYVIIGEGGEEVPSPDPQYLCPDGMALFQKQGVAPFCLDEMEVTEGDLNNNVESSNQPAVWITPDDAAEFCKMRPDLAEGRLPTYEEFEIAAKTLNIGQSGIQEITSNRELSGDRKLFPKTPNEYIGPIIGRANVGFRCASKPSVK